MRHEAGQPVLLGTTSISNNELISELLKKDGIHHELLNAKNNERCLIMLDIEKVAQEFAFLRDKIREAAEFIHKEEYSSGTFILGYLHSICNNHAVTIGNLVPPKPIEETEHKSVCE